MAKIKIAAPLSGIRGVVGGLIYNANASGPYVRAWAPPSNPNTYPQSVQRGYLSRMPQLWAALTGAQQAAWDTWAALPAQAQTDSLGNTYYLSGYQWFSKCNLRLLRVDRSTLTSPPAGSTPAAPTIDAIYVAPEGTDTDLCTGGTPSASSDDGSHTASLAFDDNTATRWQSATPGLPAWLEYQLASTAVVRRYDIYISDYTLGFNPDTWTFQAYNGATWDTLHTVTLWQVSSNGWHRFYFANDTTYTRYRLYITATRNPALTYVSIYEVAMFDCDVDATVICYAQGTFTIVAYDLIHHVAMTLSTARQVQYPDYYEILATQSPGRFYTDFESELLAKFGTIQTDRRWFAHIHRQTSEGLRSTSADLYTDTES